MAEWIAEWVLWAENTESGMYGRRGNWRHPFSNLPWRQPQSGPASCRSGIVRWLVVAGIACW